MLEPPAPLIECECVGERAGAEEEARNEGDARATPAVAAAARMLDAAEDALSRAASSTFARIRGGAAALAAEAALPSTIALRAAVL